MRAKGRASGMVVTRAIVGAKGHRPRNPRPRQIWFSDEAWMCATTWLPASYWTNAHCDLDMRSLGGQLGHFSTQERTSSCLRAWTAIHPRTTRDPRSMESYIYPRKRALPSHRIRQPGLNGGAHVLPTVYWRVPQGHADLSRNLVADASCCRVMCCYGCSDESTVLLSISAWTDTMARRHYNQRTLLEG